MSRIEQHPIFVAARWWCHLPPRGKFLTVILFAICAAPVSQLFSSLADPSGAEAAAKPTTAERVSFDLGARVALTQPTIGCREKEDAYKVLTLAVQEGDHLAAVRYGMSHSCAAFDSGMGGKVDKFGGSVFLCVRPAGEPECYWLPTPYLAKDD